mgnify:CR=1 FL=1
MVSSRDMVVFTLRKAADVLETHDGTLRLPGWERDDDAAELREVARAIAGDGVDPYEGVDVPMKAVGELVRYLADMLEE